MTLLGWLLIVIAPMPYGYVYANAADVSGGAVLLAVQALTLLPLVALMFCTPKPR